MAIDILVLSTLLVSIGDIIVNIFGFCCTGRLKIEAPCIKVEHTDKQSFTDSDLKKRVEVLERRKSI